MRYAAPFIPDLTPYEAHAASLRDWLADVTLWLIRIFAPNLYAAARAEAQRETIADLRQTAWEVRRILFMQAFARMPKHRLPRPSKRAHQPARPQSNRSAMRALTSGCLPNLNTGTPEQRAARLRHILENPEPYIARIVARLYRVCGRLRDTSPIYDRAPDAAAPAPRALLLRYADTS